MVTLPFLALAFLIVVAFFIGIAVGATLNGSTGSIEKKETLSTSTKPRTYTITFTDAQLNAHKPLDDNRVFLEISDWKPSITPNIEFVKPPDVLIKELEDKKPLPIDPIHWKPLIDKKINFIKPPDVFTKLEAKKPLPLDPIHRKPPLDIENNLIKLRNESKKKP